MITRHIQQRLFLEVGPGGGHGGHGGHEPKVSSLPFECRHSREPFSAAPACTASSCTGSGLGWFSGHGHHGHHGHP